jgi:hypothetical protein
MAKITTTPDGQITVEVSDDVEVGEVGEMGDEMDDEMDEVPDDVEGMAPVDTVTPGPEDEEGLEGDEDAMPDFEGGEGEVIEEPAGEEGPPESFGEIQHEAGETEEEEEEEHEPAFEDKDITSPQSAKYTKHVKDNKREMPTPKLPKASDDSLEDLGPTLKKDDGTGTKPPTAKKASKE